MPPSVQTPNPLPRNIRAGGSDESAADIILLPKNLELQGENLTLVAADPEM